MLVVGAGPAGSSAAQAAARAGARVLMVDRKEVIGQPVQCAEYLNKRVVMDLSLPRKAIAQDVERTVTMLMGEVASVRRNPGCILKRDVVDALLASRAGDAGARLMTRTRACGKVRVAGDVSKVPIRTRGEDMGWNLVGARVVIGADGPRSTVGSFIGAVNTSNLVAHQVTVELKDPGHDTEVYLDPIYKGGYGWLFPKEDHANVGVGVDMALGGNPRFALKSLLDDLGDRIGKVVRSTGGLIPVGGPLRPKGGNMLLAGDSAGHTHPITGGGIHQAVEAGRMAGKAAAAYVAGDTEALEGYWEDFDSLFQLTLDRAVDRRRELSHGWDGTEGDPEEFKRLMRRGWIGFREYYKKEEAI